MKKNLTRRANDVNGIDSRFALLEALLAAVRVDFRTAAFVADDAPIGFGVTVCRRCGRHECASDDAADCGDAKRLHTSLHEIERDSARFAASFMGRQCTRKAVGCLPRSIGCKTGRVGF